MMNTNELLPSPQQVVSKPRFHRSCCTSKRLVFVFILISLCGSMLTGCKDFWDTTADLLRINGKDAEAQDQTETRIKTYVINPEGFEVLLDTEGDPTPTYQIIDSATELTMRSEGLLVRGTGDSTVALELGDILILRLDGSTGSVTLIRND